MGVIIHSQDGTSYFAGSQEEYLAHFSFKKAVKKASNTASKLLGTVKKGHKYLLRIETGKKFPRYRYLYTQAEVDAYNKSRSADRSAQIVERYEETTEGAYDTAQKEYENTEELVEKNKKDREDAIAQYRNTKLEEIEEKYGKKRGKLYEKLKKVTNLHDSLQSIIKHAPFVSEKWKESALQAEQKVYDKRRNGVVSRFSELKENISYQTGQVESKVSLATSASDTVYANSKKTLTTMKANIETLKKEVVDEKIAKARMRKATSYSKEYMASPDVERKKHETDGAYQRRIEEETAKAFRDNKQANETDYEYKVKIPLDKHWTVNGDEIKLINEVKPVADGVEVYISKHDDYAYGGVKQTYSTEKVQRLPKLSVSEDNDTTQEAANPNYDSTKDPYSNEEKYYMNCQNSTMAYVMRKKGYDVEALPRTDTYSGNEVSVATQAFNNAAVVRMKSADNAHEAYLNLLRQTSLYGDGSYGEFDLFWTYGGGHSMVWSVENGDLKIRDTQIGRVYSGKSIETELLSRSIVNDADPYYNPCLVRLDNAVPDDNILQWVKERGTR